MTHTHPHPHSPNFHPRLDRTDEEVLDELSEDGLVLVDELGQVEVAQRAQQDALLLDHRLAALEATSHAQHGLRRARTRQETKRRGGGGGGESKSKGNVCNSKKEGNRNETKQD